MASNPMTRANILDAIDNIIGSTLTSTWTDTKKNLLVDNALSEISEAVPYVMVDIYQIETRTGLATSTSSNNLVDATNAQFLSTDVGKVIYNTTDNTWAQIQSYSSSSQVGLTKDIMASGEGYEIYNENCWNKYQINIEDSGDFLGVIGAVYPVEPDFMFGGSPNYNMKNVKLLNQNRIAEIDTWYGDNSANTGAEVDVHLYLARQHHLEVNTDLIGAATAGGTAGATSLGFDALGTAAEVYYKNSLFYFTLIDAVVMNSRLTYRLTADATMSSGAGTLKFFPGLECNTTDNDTIEFVSSTLTPDLERILIDIVTGQILMGEGINSTTQINKGGDGTASRQFEMGRVILGRARQQLKGMVDVDLRANMIWAR